MPKKAARISVAAFPPHIIRAIITISAPKFDIMSVRQFSGPASGASDFCTGLYKKWNIYIPLIFDDIGSVRIADIKKELIAAFCEDRGLPAGNIELEYSMDMYISCVLSSINKWRHDGRDLSYEALGALIQKLLMHGILPQIIAYLPDKTNRI